MRKEIKAQIIESISAQLQETPNFYITDISGLNAEQTTKLRRACFEAGIKLKPQTLKGTYLLGASICTTMSPGVTIDIKAFSAEL